jgi:hypothetical protein
MAMTLGNKAGKMVFASVLLLGLFLGAGCSPSDEDDATNAPASRAARYPGLAHFPRELRKVVRHDGRGLSETLTAVPGMFILSYSCDNAGRKALTVTGYPRSATSQIEIRAAGRTVARGHVYPGRVPGPFLDADGSQTVIAHQATSAQIQGVRVKVKFDAQGQCRVDDLNLEMHRKS